MFDPCLHARTSGGINALTRLVARLHAIRAEVHELHALSGSICVHLRSEPDLQRALTTLSRHADLIVERGCACPSRRLGPAVFKTARPVVCSQSRPD